LQNSNKFTIVPLLPCDKFFSFPAKKSLAHAATLPFLPDSSGVSRPPSPLCGLRSRFNLRLYGRALADDFAILLRDYGYVDARGMGIRTKVIPLMRQYNHTEPVVTATEDYLSTILLRRI